MMGKEAAPSSQSNKANTALNTEVNLTLTNMDMQCLPRALKYKGNGEGAGMKAGRTVGAENLDLLENRLSTKA